ncbi:methyl-accepting chemotaxis protein [Roseateles terrae]|uniref:Methyl-accepting chemotaxis protein n=1 Tax=Roseateles terrae TaxID=431060 RepID=A0ABR6GL28_9BURK|nr:methyl-accepting chemotaxis protein [Roseateles terrae]MBB3192819.1 methyl-accepting chemotaxis protein [Roseateles terrae]OWQ89913.1 hypothetical protein CDN98_05310 [Roseateles terrae]
MKSRFGVGAKLAGSFGLVLLMLIGLGITAVIQLARVNDVADDMHTNWLPSTRQVSAIAQHVNRYRIREYRVLITEADKMTAALTRMQESKEAVDKAIAAYGPMVSSDEEGRKYKEVATLWAKYLERADQLKSAAGSEDLVLAKRLVTVDGLATFDQLNKAMEELTEINTQGAQSAAELGSQIYASGKVTMFAVSLLAIVVGSGCAFIITRGITRPLAESVKLAETVADGDLTVTLNVRGTDEVAQLQLALLSMVDRLKGVVAQVRDGVSAVSGASSQIAAGNSDLSSRTESTSANLQQTASSMEQLTGTVSQSADTARQANQMAASAAEAAQKGGEAVGQVVERMREISDASRRISDITSTIDSIAFQTNILALNAAVEAARAGEQGRGFAVVASEVRTLAQRSAVAAKEIRGLIDHSVQTVSAGSTEVAKAGEAMGQIVNGVSRVTDLMGEIAAASSEQRDGINQVNQSVANLDQMTQQNAALVEESSAAAASLRDQAARLADVVAVFRVGMAT